MKIGDTVMILNGTKYGNDLIGKIGVIVKIYGSVRRNIVVKIHGLVNKKSSLGVFYFDTNDITTVGFAELNTFNEISSSKLFSTVSSSNHPNTCIIHTKQPQIEKVIFNNPATIVLWKDGTKTVVKKQKGDRFDKEKGLCMAIVKKIYGNTGKYYEIIKPWLEEMK